METTELTVGCDIGICGTYDYQDGIGIIVKKNGHGHILVEVGHHGTAGSITEVWFDKNGKERGVKFSPRRLCRADTIHARRENHRKRNECNKRVEALLAAVNSHRCGNGSYYITAETKAQLIELANALTVLE